MVTGLVRKWTKRGDLMAVFTLEDLADSVECMVFPKTMQLWGHLLTEETNDQVVLLEGRVDRRDDLPKLVVVLGGARRPERGGDRARRCGCGCREPLRPAAASTSSRTSSAPIPARPRSSSTSTRPGDEQVIRLADGFAVDTSNGLVGELRALLGAEAVLL